MNNGAEYVEKVRKYVRDNFGCELKPELGLPSAFTATDTANDCYLFIVSFPIPLVEKGDIEFLRMAIFTFFNSFLQNIFTVEEEEDNNEA